MERYYKIGEISKLYHIGVDAIRYYESLGLITPKRTESGYRLYSAHDIWRLNVIRDLRELGFGMEQIGAYLKNHTASSTLHMLEEELDSIEKKMTALRRLKENVEQRIETIHTAQNRLFGKCELVSYPPRRCFYLSEGYERDEEMDLLIKRLLNQDPQRLYVVGSNQIGSVIPREKAEQGAYRSYQAVFLIDENGEHTLEGGTYLTVTYQGDYGQMEQLISQMIDYAKKHRLNLCGDILELLWLDIHVSADPAEYITELQVRVEKTE